MAGVGYDRGDASVTCPYYVACVDRSIICEGGIDPGGKTETRFRTKEAKREHMDKCCRGCFAACAICRANDAAYGFVRPPSA